MFFKNECNLPIKLLHFWQIILYATYNYNNYCIYYFSVYIIIIVIYIFTSPILRVDIIIVYNVYNNVWGRLVHSVEGNRYIWLRATGTRPRKLTQLKVSVQNRFSFNFDTPISVDRYLLSTFSIMRYSQNLYYSRVNQLHRFFCLSDIIFRAYWGWYLVAKWF